MSSFFTRTFSFKKGSSSSSSLYSNSLPNEENKPPNKRIFKEEISFKNMNQNVDDWKLPSINHDDVYFIHDRQWFSKSEYVIKSVEQAVPVKPEKEEYTLLSKSSIEKHKKEFNYIHVGCVQVALKPMFREGLNVSGLICLLDQRHYDFQNQILATVEFGLHNGPIFFNCFLDRQTFFEDENVLDMLKLKIKLQGLNMKPGSIPLALIYRIKYKVSTSTTSLVQKPPKDKDHTILFQTDQNNTNISIPKTMMWNDVTLLDEWIIDKAAEPVLKSVPQLSRVTQTSDGTVKLSFQISRRSFSQSSRSQPSNYADCRSVLSNVGSNSARHS